MKHWLPERVGGVKVELWLQDAGYNRCEGADENPRRGLGCALCTVAIRGDSLDRDGFFSKDWQRHAVSCVLS